MTGWWVRILTWIVSTHLNPFSPVLSPCQWNDEQLHSALKISMCLWHSTSRRRLPCLLFSAVLIITSHLSRILMTWLALSLSGSNNTSFLHVFILSSGGSGVCYTDTRFICCTPASTQGHLQGVLEQLRVSHTLPNDTSSPCTYTWVLM